MSGRFHLRSRTLRFQRTCPCEVAFSCLLEPLPFSEPLPFEPEAVEMHQQFHLRKIAKEAG